MGTAKTSIEGVTGVVERARLILNREFPAYAYLPGRFPHPVRDSGGHSHGLPPHPLPNENLLSAEEFCWGLDLFNHEYFWEAHEAWEGLWQASYGAEQGLLKGLILLSASGVKVREGKAKAALRHAKRAAQVFELLPQAELSRLKSHIGMYPSEAAQKAIAAIEEKDFGARPYVVAATVFPYLLVPIVGNDDRPLT